MNTANLVNTVLDQMTDAIAASGAVITCGPLPTVNADESQLSQVFLNLISNAIKYRKPHTSPHIHISAETRPGQVIFSVQGDGIGIAPQYHEHIFLIFRRLHRNEYPGTGVGLALARRIIENHGGHIWVKSEPGKGSTFCFSLPVR